MVRFTDLLIDLGLSVLGLIAGGLLYNVSSFFTLALSFPVMIGAIAFGGYKIFKFIEREV